MIPIQNTYKLTYRQCFKNKSHPGEPLNYVCLQSNCKSNPLICSLCKHQKHINHRTQPLKMFVQQLNKNYASGGIDYTEQLEKLQFQKDKCFYQLRMAVQKISENIQKVQESLLNHFQIVRKSILQEISKKSRFCEFYDSLGKKNEESDPNFLIQNYLNTKDDKLFSNYFVPNFLQLEKSCEQILQNLTKTLVSPQKLQKIQPMKKPLNHIKWPKLNSIKSLEELYKSFILPQNIAVNKNLYQQKNCKLNAQSIIVIPFSVGQFFKNSTTQMDVQITKLAKKSFLYVGVIEKETVKNLDLTFPIHPLDKITPENKNKYNKKIFCLSSQGLAYGEQISNIKTFSLDSTVTMRCQKKGKQLTLGLHKKLSRFVLPDQNTQYFPFVCLLGNIQVLINFQNMENWKII